MWNRTENQIELYLIRHGATRANLEHRYLGRTDEELSPEGKEELLARKAAGNYPAVDAVLVSPMKRSRQTAEILYPERTPFVIEEFREMDFGVFEGKNYEELRGNMRYQAWIDSNGALPFPEGESQADFIERCRTGLLRMLAYLETMDQNAVSGAGEAAGQRREAGMGGQRAGAQPQGAERLKAAAIVHGGTIMALLGAYGEQSYFDYQCDNGGGYRCQLTFGADFAGTLLPESITASDIRRL